MYQVGQAVIYRQNDKKPMFYKTENGWQLFNGDKAGLMDDGFNAQPATEAEVLSEAVKHGWEKEYGYKSPLGYISISKPSSEWRPSGWTTNIADKLNFFWSRMYYSPPIDNSTKPSEMIKHFTTPEFADLLKSHGIEIDTIFLHYNGKVWASYLNHYHTYMLIATDMGGMIISSNINAKPAYLLSEVLGWLPKSIIVTLPYHGETNTVLDCLFDINNKQVLYGYGREQMENGILWDIYPLPIEQLITQGLTEGWLTKEIIEQAIKQNQ